MARRYLMRPGRKVELHSRNRCADPFSPPSPSVIDLLQLPAWALGWAKEYTLERHVPPRSGSAPRLTFMFRFTRSNRQNDPLSGRKNFLGPESQLNLFLVARNLKGCERHCSEDL